MEFKNIFVTVGTTKFKKLVDKIQDQNVVNVIKRLNCKQLTVQAGTYDLESFNLDIFKSLDIIVNLYNYKDSLQEDMFKADLIIGHAGAGTCLEGLRLEKKMLIVINEDLMDNHQAELAIKLTDENYAEHCTIETIEESLNGIKNKQFKPFPKQNTKLLADFIDEQFEDFN